MTGKLSELTAKAGTDTETGSYFEIVIAGENYTITRAELFQAIVIAASAATALAGAGVHATQDKIPIGDNGVGKHILVTELQIAMVALATAMTTGFHATQDHLPYDDNGVAKKITLPYLAAALVSVATAITSGFHATEDHLPYDDNGVASKITIPNLLAALISLNTTALLGAGVHATQDKLVIGDNDVPSHITVPELAAGIIALSASLTGSGVVPGTDTVWVSDAGVSKKMTFTEFMTALTLAGFTLADIPEYADQAAAQAGLTGTGKLWRQTTTGLLGVTIA